MNKRKKIFGAAIPAFAGLMACALYNRLVVRRYFLTSSKIAEPVTFVLVSDLHNSLFGKNQKDLIGLIKGQSPDLIFITGDIVDSIKKTGNAQAFLSGIKNICPAYYVTGNHEYRTRYVCGIREMIEKSGAVILSDSFVPIEVKGNRLIISGVDDPEKRYRGYSSYSQKKAMQTAFGGLPDMREYKILLSHKPESIGRFLPYKFDLVVSGHAHGGQVRVPFLLNGLYSPSQGMFPKLAGGKYGYGSTTLIVSRGASFYWTIPRVFNPPEVVVIRLSGDTK